MEFTTKKKKIADFVWRPHGRVNFLWFVQRELEKASSKHYNPAEMMALLKSFEVSLMVKNKFVGLATGETYDRFTRG